MSDRRTFENTDELNVYMTEVIEHVTKLTLVLWQDEYVKHLMEESDIDAVPITHEQLNIMFAVATTHTVTEVIRRSLAKDLGNEDALLFEAEVMDQVQRWAEAQYGGA